MIQTGIQKRRRRRRRRNKNHGRRQGRGRKVVTFGEASLEVSERKKGNVEIPAWCCDRVPDRVDLTTDLQGSTIANLTYSTAVDASRPQWAASKYILYNLLSLFLKSIILSNNPSHFTRTLKSISVYSIKTSCLILLKLLLIDICGTFQIN